MSQESCGVTSNPETHRQSEYPSDLGRRYPMTVVIATLGGSPLKNTIEALNRGTVIPEEILLCIPVAEAHRVEDISFHNVTILITDCRGQVAQRAVGFRNASHAIVMQLDDDLLVEVDCLSHLLKTLNAHGPKLAVAPALMDIVTGESTYKKPERNKLIHKIYYWILNGSDGYQPGKIDKSGTPIGIDPKNKSEQLFEVEWLAGGCVMHYKENLVLTNFYPFKGKAYYEDVIHSYHLRKAEIKLMVDSKARCWLEPAPPLNCGSIEFLTQLRADFRARKHAMRLFSNLSFRMYFFYVARYFIFLLDKIKSLNKQEKPADYPS